MTSLTIDVVRRRSWHDVGLLLAVFVGAVAVRGAIAGPAGAWSISAAVVFAAVLGVTVGITRSRPRVTARAVAIGVLGAAVLVAPVVVTGPGVVHRGHAFAGWAVATAVVATAEEAFLRGSLFDAVTRWRGANAAVVVTAVAFALMHLPLYGVKALPLDLAVGIGLGALRLLAGSWTAPAVAHVGADLFGWWFV